MHDNPSLPDTALKRLRRVQVLTKALDQAFRVPGTPIRFGLDGVIGLVPGLGDLVTAGLSGYILYEAAKLGVSRPVLIRMLANIGIDLAAGSIPVVGDLFDVVWKANVKNLALLEQHLEANRPKASEPPRRRRFLPSRRSRATG